MKWLENTQHTSSESVTWHCSVAIATANRTGANKEAMQQAWWLMQYVHCTCGGEVVGYLWCSWLMQGCNFWLSLSHGAVVISLSDVKHQSEDFMMMGALYSRKGRVSSIVLGF